ncbi:hypothetical protein MSPP1_002756 [Malassezia sp. CBS 17886]|nr:hypothetical protein MSPP1_002756 [Malassezia sp. CBS 17886]
MPQTVYVARHGSRMASSHFHLAVDMARDPPLTAHGEGQVRDLAASFAAMPRDERPQLVITSPYTRCVCTAVPVAEALGVEFAVEPGLAEWFAPVWPADSGVHPSPPAARHVRACPDGVSARWDPLLYPDPQGESMDALHVRMYESFRRLRARCEGWGVERVLLVSHAASSIALGRMLQTGGSLAGATHDVRAGTASVSKYVRDERSERWTQVYNGNTDFLPGGSEREWDFSFVPSNNTEPGMGAAWHDEHAPKDASLIFRARL